MEIFRKKRRIYWTVVTFSIIPLLILSLFFIKALFMILGSEGFLSSLKPILNVWHQNELLREAWIVSADKNPVISLPIITAYLLWLVGMILCFTEYYRSIKRIKYILIIVIVLLFPSLVYLYGELFHYPSVLLAVIPLAFPMTALMFIIAHQWRVTEAKVVPIGHASAGKTFSLIATFHAIRSMKSQDLDMKFYKKGKIAKEELEEDTVAMANVGDKLGKMLEIIDKYEYRNIENLYYGQQLGANLNLEKLNFQITRKRRFLPELKLWIESADYGGSALFSALVKENKGEVLTNEEKNIIETTTNAEAFILFIDPVLACPDLIKANYGKIPDGVEKMVKMLNEAHINNIGGVLEWYRALVDRAIKKELKCVAIVIPKLDITMDPEYFLRENVIRNVEKDAEELIINDSIRSKFYKDLQDKLHKRNVKIFPIWVVSQPYVGQKAKEIDQGLLLPIIKQTENEKRLIVGGQIEVIRWLMDRLLET